MATGEQIPVHGVVPSDANQQVVQALNIALAPFGENQSGSKVPPMLLPQFAEAKSDLGGWLGTLSAYNSGEQWVTRDAMEHAVRAGNRGINRLMSIAESAGADPAPLTRIADLAAHQSEQIMRQINGRQN